MKAKKQDLENLGRLKKRSEFLCVAHGGYKWVSPSVIVQLMPVASDDKSTSTSYRFGVTATKRLGKAPLRNRTKRRLRAALKDLLAEDNHPLTNVKSGDIVLIGRAPTADIEYSQLIKDLKWCLKRLSGKILEGDPA